MSLHCYPSSFGAANLQAHHAAPYSPVVDKGVNLMGMGQFPRQQQGEVQEHPPGLHEAVPSTTGVIPARGEAGDTSRGHHA